MITGKGNDILMAAHAMVVRAGGTPGSQDHSEVGEAAREAPSCCCEKPCPRRHLPPWHLEPGTEAGARATGRGRGRAGPGPAELPRHRSPRGCEKRGLVHGTARARDRLTVTVRNCGRRGASGPCKVKCGLRVRGVGVEGTHTPGVEPSSEQVCVVWVSARSLSAPRPVKWAQSSPCRHYWRGAVRRGKEPSLSGSL